MKYLLILSLVSFSAFAKRDQLDDFNKQLMMKFDQDVKLDNDQKIKKSVAPMRGPASVAPEADLPVEEKKIDKSVRQTGHKNW